MRAHTYYELCRITGGRTSLADPNTRQGKRTPVTLKIKFKSETLEQFIERYAVDVSQGGIFIRTKEPLAVGTQMKFEFQLRDASPLIAGEGTVVWTRENDPSRPAIAPGMGVRFDRLAEAASRCSRRSSPRRRSRHRSARHRRPTKPPMFTDTPTRVAPAPVQEALGVRQRAAVDRRARLGQRADAAAEADAVPLGRRRVRRGGVRGGDEGSLARRARRADRGRRSEAATKPTCDAADELAARRAVGPRRLDARGSADRRRSRARARRTSRIAKRARSAEPARRRPPASRSTCRRRRARAGGPRETAAPSAHRVRRHRRRPRPRPSSAWSRRRRRRGARRQGRPRRRHREVDRVPRAVAAEPSRPHAPAAERRADHHRRARRCRRARSRPCGSFVLRETGGERRPRRQRGSDAIVAPGSAGSACDSAAQQRQRRPSMTGSARQRGRSR